MMCLTLAKTHAIWLLFKYICHQELSKIAQSAHTAVFNHYLQFGTTLPAQIS